MKEYQTRFTTEALVIREMNVGESDRLVTLFTRDYGIIKAFVSGAKNIKSKKAAATSLLSYSSVTILKKKDTYKIYEAEAIRVFFGAGSDIEVLSLSQYFCELSEEFATSGVANEEFFRLILNSLYFLTKEKRNPSVIKAITELRLAVIAGYMPDLVACCECGAFESDFMYFDLAEGCLYCENCKQADGLVKINLTILKAMRHIVYSEFKNLYSFSVSEDTAKYLSDLTGRYITVQTDHNFSTLDFYNTIKE